MNKSWDAYVDRLRSQIADLKETLHSIKSNTHDRRPALEEATQDLRQLVESPQDSKGVLYSLPKILQTILTNPQVGAMFVGPDGNVLLFNAAAETILGPELIQTQEWTPSMGYFMADKETLCTSQQLPWRQAFSVTDMPAVELFVRRPGVLGGLWIRTTSTPLKGEDGEVGGVVAFLIDITENVHVGAQIESVCENLEQQISAISSAHGKLKTLTDKLGQITWEVESEGAPRQAARIKSNGGAVSQPATAPTFVEPQPEPQQETHDVVQESPAKHSKPRKTFGELMAESKTSESLLEEGAFFGRLGEVPKQEEAPQQDLTSAVNDIIESMEVTDPEEAPRQSVKPTLYDTAKPDLSGLESEPAAELPEPPQLKPQSVQEPSDTEEPSQSVSWQPEPEVETEKINASPILVVDDVAVNHKLLALQLRKLGYDVHTATNGKEALELIGQYDYSLVLMDCDMPVMDGYEATNIIREHEKGSEYHLPIVAMTSYDRDGDRERCLEAGMDDHVSKGASQKRLKEVVERYTKPKAQAPEQGLELPDTPPRFDLESLRKAYGTEEMQEILRLFTSSASTFVELLELAIEEKNSEAVSHFAFSVKGPCHSLGLRSLVRLLGEVTSHAEAGDWNETRAKYLMLRASFERVKDQFQKACSLFSTVDA